MVNVVFSASSGRQPQMASGLTGNLVAKLSQGTG
jgi:hypothetical protein